MEINRVIEVDMDTRRESTVQVRIVKKTPYREGIVPHKKDSKADIIVLANGLIAAILRAEEDGTYEKGEGMEKTIKNLQEYYVDANVTLNDSMYKEDGTLESN